MKRLEYRAIEVGLERLRGVSKNQLRSLVIYRRKRCDTTGVRVSPLAFLFIGSIKCLVPPHNVGLIPQMVGQLADIRLRSPQRLAVCRDSGKDGV